MIMRKIAAFAVAISFIIAPQVPLAEASEVEPSMYRELLEAVGINVPAKSEGGVTRAEFATMSAGLFPDFEASSNVSYFADVESGHSFFMGMQKAYEQGIIRGDGRGSFFPDEPIAGAGAVKMLICALGYDSIAQNKGGYPSGYLITAQSLGLLAGVSDAFSEELSHKTAVRLVYNALFTNVMDFHHTEANETFFSTNGNNPLLKERFDIDYVNGVLTAAGKYALTEAQEVRVGYVRIGNEIYPASGRDMSGLLGRNVRLYYRDRGGDDEEKETIAAFALNFDEITVCKNNQIEQVMANSQTYTVETEDEGRLTFSRFADIIYNGRCFVDYNPMDLAKLSYGTVTFISNDNDGIYDVLIIKEYKTGVTEAYNSIENGIYFRNNTTYGLSSPMLELSLDEPDIEVIIKDTDGITVQPTDLKKNYVLSVSRSADGSRTEIIVTNEVIYGSAVSINYDDRIIELNEKIYEISEESLLNSKNIILGEVMPYFLNSFGQVVFADKNYSDQIRYGYAVEYNVKNNLAANSEMRVFTETGQMADYTLADKLDCNGIRIKVRNIGDDMLLFPGGVFKRQLIQYREMEGVIKGIICATDYTTDASYSGYDENIFSKDYSVQMNGRFRASVKVLDSRYMLDGSTVVFVIPEDHTDYDSYLVSDASFYAVDSSAISGVDVYDSTQDKTARALVVNASAKEYGDIVFLLDRVTAAQSENGEDVTVLYGYEDGKSVSYTISGKLRENAKVLKRGDVLLLNKVRGVVLSFITATTLPDDVDFAEADRMGGNAYNGRYVFARGIIENRGLVSFNMRISDVVTPLVYPITQDTRAYMLTNHGIIPCDVSKASKGARVLVHRRSDAARLIVIYDK